MNLSTTHRVCVAPMMGWTHRHCRYFHRLLTSHTRLYTEMVTTGALLHGDAARYLAFNPEEHPVALQLGGNSPSLLAKCAQLAEQWQYDEVNLNCGCPSERVQQGAFGACLMRTPYEVADCVKAMRDIVSIPITVKHRIGVDHEDSYAFMRDFVGIVAEAGCDTFIVHARKALLKGLNPKQNRVIPPLQYERVYRLKRDFPNLKIILNGGIQTIEQMAMHLKCVDGVMLGREAIHNPWILSQVDPCFYVASEALEKPITRETVFESWQPYAKQVIETTPASWKTMIRPLFGLYKGQPGARHWRHQLAEELH